jgi:hypothetical protein
MIVSRDDPEGVIEMAVNGRGRPKIDGPEADRLLKRRMDVLTLRRKGHTNPAIADALECTVANVVGDVRWLRLNGYDIGQRPSGHSDPIPHGEVELLRAPAPPDDGSVRAEVQKRRVNGEDILSISIAMGIPAREVRTHLREAARQANIGTDMEERRSLQLARLDKLLLSLEEGVRDGNPKAINAAVRVIAEGNRLQGLYAPVQVEHTVITLDMVEAEMRRLSGELAKIETLELTDYVDVDGESVE